MSKERDFHRLIEEQNPEEKERVWKKIESRIESERDNVEGGGEVIVLSKSKRYGLIRNVAICCLAALFFGVAVFLILRFTLPENDGFIADDRRYCTVNDYHKVDTDVTVKQYAFENGKNILYFDIYGVSEYYCDSRYLLNGTDEVICLLEEIVDEAGAYISFYVTDDRTDIDFLDSYSSNCYNQTSVNSVTVEWGSVNDASMAKFQYGGYCYYISVDVGEDYVLQLVHALLG